MTKELHSPQIETVAHEKGYTVTLKTNSDLDVMRVIREAGAMGNAKVRIVGGDHSLCHAMWVEGSLRGLTVEGYTPTKEEESALAQIKAAIVEAAQGRVAEVAGVREKDTIRVYLGRNDDYQQFYTEVPGEAYQDMRDCDADRAYYIDLTKEEAEERRVINQPKKERAGSLNHYTEYLIPVEQPETATRICRISQGDLAREAMRYELPPPAPDCVRLYRGQVGSDIGEWYTTEREVAEGYMRELGSEGRLVYVDVPRDEAEKYRACNQSKGVQRFARDLQNDYAVHWETAEAATTLIPTGLGLEMEASLRNDLSTAIDAADAPVGKDAVRLYRGEVAPEFRRDPPEWIAAGKKERGITDAEGRWFTDKRENAEWYMKEAGAAGRMVYVDVPKELIEACRVCNQPAEVQRFSLDPQNEYFLSKELAQAARAFAPAELAAKALESEMASVALTLVSGAPYRATPAELLLASQHQQALMKKEGSRSISLDLPAFSVEDEEKKKQKQLSR